MTIATVGEFERRGGLLVPAWLRERAAEATVVDAEYVQVDDRPDVPAGQADGRIFDDLEPARPGSAEHLAGELAERRAVIDVRREDTLVRRALDAEHQVAMADVEEQAAAAARARRERARDAEEATALAELYRRAARSGARARIRTQIQGSAEMRALRVARVRSATLIAGGPILAAFAAWSTAGVQAGVVRLLGLADGSAGWWAAWAMEPALIAVVGLIIIARAVLRSAGGDTDRRADWVERAALGTSLLLNIVGGWDTTQDLGTWQGVLAALGAMLAHSVGPIGAAGTAYLIGLFDSYVSAARPWKGAPRLAEMNLDMPAAAGLRGGVPDGYPDADFDAGIPTPRVSAGVASLPAAPSMAEIELPKTSGFAEIGADVASHGGHWAPRRERIVAAAKTGARKAVTAPVNGSAAKSVARPEGRPAGPVAAAEAAWRRSVADGQPLSGRELGELFGLSQSWGGNVIRAARAKDEQARAAAQ
jgi:hypothetical protein